MYSGGLPFPTSGVQTIEKTLAPHSAFAGSYLEYYVQFWAPWFKKTDKLECDPEIRALVDKHSGKQAL